MSTSADKAPQISGKSPQGCGRSRIAAQARFDTEAMAAFLRVRHPHSTSYAVSAVTGIPAGTIENWLLKRSGPHRDHISILLCVYGPAFLKACLSAPPEWVSTAYQAVVEEELRTSIREAEDELARIVGQKKTEGA